MPLYTYKCSACSLEFDEIVKYDDRDKKQTCKLCKGESERMIAVPFGIAATLNPQTQTIATNSEIDRVVGADADRKRAMYADRADKRRKGQELKELALPKEKDGKTAPIMHLGDQKDKELRKEFVGALQEHRAQRSRKGLEQFDGPGAIQE